MLSPRLRHRRYNTNVQIISAEDKVSFSVGDSVSFLIVSEADK